MTAETLTRDVLPAVNVWYVGNPIPAFHGTSGDVPLALPTAIRQWF